MDVLITGASGLIGTALREALIARGDTVIGVSRDPNVVELGPETEWITWHQLQEGIDRSTAVVHLAGAGIADRRWTPARKRELRASRIDTAGRVVAAIRDTTSGPRVLISGSAVGYYGPRGDEPIDESGTPGEGFLADLCRDWEAAAARSGVRTVLARTGVVLAERSGALPKMAVPFRLGLGGRVGSGDQWISWIHLDDVVHLILHAIDSELEGPLNVTAPQPVTNRELTKALGRTLKRPTVLRVPSAFLRLQMGEGASVVTTGQRVLPAKAAESGYAFRFADVDAGLADLIG